MSLQSVSFRVPTTCTITRLRFLGGPGGVFDVPKEKCPPDGGSSSCVTGNSTPFSPLLKQITPTSFSLSSYDASPSSVMPLHSISNRQFSRSISSSATSNSSDMLTPPLTPDSFDHSGTGNFPTQNPKAPKDTLDFLLTVFPRHGMAALPYAKGISISAPNLGAAFDGVILHLPGEQRTLYVDGSSAESVNLRESIVALLDLADERLGCSGLVIALDRSCLNLGALLHSLMYVGGTVLTRPPFEVDPTFILVGLEV